MSDHWGSDVPPSMPEPIDPSQILVDFGTHVFTPDGLRIKMSREVREDLISHAFLPPGG